MLLLLQASVGTVLIDNLEVVRSLQRGRQYACSTSQSYADIWVMIYDKLEDAGLVPGENLEAREECATPVGGLLRTS